ncbi:major facilitator superfamily domain-containing protein [Boeremia exigua]|uniref:major facilitator superfamily domain-containing protein n=1 Tax=Boeremia exigua TaxID=749465 RepID=UPI001E8E082A|nr:major facilitator superfamily domain-containing protein [Boeremia exigua]KAH6642409.1 major facilitator superfamily domain-containing protein [Boeremia exigua]
MATIQESEVGPNMQETTPLLSRTQSKEAKEGSHGLSVQWRLMLCAFLVSLSFGITQVPLLYVFRVMTCDAYYEDPHHVRDPAAKDVCAKHEIEASTARSVALLAGSTTLFGLVNLIITGWTIKRLGVKKALVIQIFWPAVRLLVQNIGVSRGSSTGILIVQASQIITIVGGPNGYVLALNSFVADVVEHEDRTGALGRLQGCMLFGAAVGFLIGGLVGEAFGVIAPFRMTVVLFLLSCVYVTVCLPSTPPHEEKDNHTDPAPNGLGRFFGPLRIFTPQKWTLVDGRMSVQFGALTLGLGVFLGILATGYIPTLLQMYATDEFEFGTRANGWLIFMYSSLRGFFLAFVFPRIIAFGRRCMEPKAASPANLAETQPLLGGLPSPNEVGPVESDSTSIASPRPEQKQTFAFDLMYARFSLLLDGAMTGLAVFVSQGYQLFIVAALLPLAAGTAAASKGTILQMLPNNQRVDALSGITLVENIARLSTTAVFGLVFAALAEVGKIPLVFVCNAAVALLGFTVLLLSRFPPTGSRRAELG